MPEETKSSDLLRITDSSCICCFSAESSLKSLFFFSRYSLILAKEVLFYSLTASSFRTGSLSFSISDQTAFFSQIPNLTLYMQHRYPCSQLLICFWVYTWHKVQSFGSLNPAIFAVHHAENLILVPFTHSITVLLSGLDQSHS